MKQFVIRDRHFYILLALFIACTAFYYFGELVKFFGWDALSWDIFYTVHDLQRMLFLIPILYSSYFYRVRGALMANIISLLIFLPRAFLISPYLEATLRTVFFVMIAAVFSTFTVLIFNQRDKRNKLIDTLKQAEEKYRIVLEQMYDSYYEVDLAGNFTLVNDSVCRDLGYSREEMIGNNYRLTITEDDAKSLQIAFNEVFKTGEPNKGLEHKTLCKDGSIMFVESTISLRKNEQGDIIGFRSISRNITERRQKEDELRESEERYRNLFTASLDAVMTLEPPSWLFTSANPATLEMFRAKNEADFLSHAPWTLSPELQPDGSASDEKAREMINTAMREGSNFFEWVHKRIGGEEFFADVLLSRVKQGEKIFLHALVRDMTEHKQLQQKLEKAATHDYLTGLPNRVLLTDRFTMAAALAHRNKVRLAVISLDLDKFKSINDTLGHEAGDQVLKTVATRLTGLIRASDTLARIGGDEFVLVMLENKRREDATIIAKRILDSFAEPFLIDGHQLHLSTSIGIAIYLEDGLEMETLIKKSDAAMYYSKGHGRNQFKFFSDGDVRMGGDHRSGN
jgi:diguanylate cyclase (GGDEF)-like protein/PAS domain S-box-containing protein